MKKIDKYKMIRIISQSVLIVIFVLFIIYITIKSYPYFIKINDDQEFREQFINQIRSYGWMSFFIVLGLQIFQTIFMIIPSGPIVMVSGVLFHPFIAVLVCLIGQTLGSLIVYYLVKIFGYKFIVLFISPDQVKNSKLLGNEKRTEVLMFGYLLIPALPKDIIAFVAPFTNIKIQNFIFITFFARIPMTIVTVLMGNSLIKGNYLIVIILGIISFILAMLCFIFNTKIVAILERRGCKNEAS
ncbi:MAG: TVP38/TMEM64 family protein [Anaeroplasma sp.]